MQAALFIIFLPGGKGRIRGLEFARHCETGPGFNEATQNALQMFWVNVVAFSSIERIAGKMFNHSFSACGFFFFFF